MDPFNEIVQNLSDHYQIPKVDIGRDLFSIYRQHGSLKVAEAILIEQLRTDFGHSPKSFYPGIEAVDHSSASVDSADFQSKRDCEFQEIRTSIKDNVIGLYLENDDIMSKDGVELISTRGLIIMILANLKIIGGNELAIIMTKRIFETIAVKGNFGDAEVLQNRIMDLEIEEILDFAKNAYEHKWVENDDVINALESCGAKFENI
jgi:hypothetical protein